MTLFPDAPLLTFENDGQPIAYRAFGQGPSVVLLHGFPQTHAMWARIAPELAKDFRVICPDLRGYGASFKPATMPEMSFRAMSADVLALMQSLGSSSFHVIGHDRGARVAHRLSLDAPDAVASLTLMDIVPTLYLLDTLTHQVARAYYHWFFLAQPAPFPETMIGHDPDAYYERCLLGFGKAALSDFDPDMLRAYRDAWRDPDAIRCMCDDYRAAIDVDIAHDAIDLDRRVPCPSLILYGADGAMAKALDVPATWASRLGNMQAQAIPDGHFFPDQSPEHTTRAIREFLATAAL